MPKAGIDIGHRKHTFPSGGKGVYRNGKGYAEFDFNEKVGLRLKALLEHNGVEVVMQPNYANRAESLTGRTNFFNQQNVDILVSIHANAGVAGASGRCAFYWHTSSKGKKLAQNIINEIKVAGYSTHGNGLHASKPGSWTNLHMVRETRMPAVLVEHGFMTNAKDFELIFGSKQDEYVEDMAQADAKAICNYFGIAYKGSTKSNNAEANVKGATDKVEPVKKSGAYTVKAGDTLSEIAEDFGTTAQAIAEENGIKNPDKIYVGQKLTIGKPKAAPKKKTTIAGAELVKEENAYFLATENIKVRNAPSTSATHTGTLPKGASINYFRVFEGNGYRWLEYVGNSGNTLYLPYRRLTGNTKSWGTFHGSRPSTIKVGDKVTAGRLFVSSAAISPARATAITGYVERINDNWRNPYRLVKTKGQKDYLGFAREGDLSK